VIPDAATAGSVVTISADRLLAALRTIAPVADEDARRVRLLVTPREVTVTARFADDKTELLAKSGVHLEDRPHRLVGPAFCATFNHEYAGAFLALDEGPREVTVWYWPDEPAWNERPVPQAMLWKRDEDVYVLCPMEACLSN